MDRGACRWDAASFGEIMLRLDPGDGRIHTAREFRVWEGGGEYNVVRGLRRCFGLKTTAVTAFADNPVGRLVEDFMMQGGVDTGWIKWVPYDGIGRTVRNGLNFVERGFGVRGARSCADRGLTAISQLKPGDIDWERLFGEEGVRWFHTGGICAALSESTAEVVVEALKAAIPKLGAVIIDTWNNEPDVDQELLSMVDIATPHIAGYSYQGKQRSTAAAVKTVARFFDIKPLLDFFPVTQVKELEAVKLDVRGKSQGQIASLFQYNYPIFIDDFMFRVNPGGFVGIRENYSYRREFYIE